MNLFRIFLSILLTISSFCLWGQADCIGDVGQLNFHYWNDISGTNLNNLLTDERFPNTPDGTVLLSGLRTPVSFNDFFGGRIRGFIKPSETGNYIFNVRGNNEVDFHLSSDDTPNNLEKICEVFTLSGVGHDDFPEQTSDTIELQADEYYFFELLIKHSTGGDYANIYWKTPSNTTEWSIVEGVSVYGYTCEMLCAPYGTTCDDANPDTENDIEDGNCNCYGQPIAGTTCIGKRGQLNVWYYEDIEGSYLAELEASPLFPDSPSNGATLSNIVINQPQGLTYGAYLKGFIRIPTTSDYQFQFFGNNESRLLWSSGSSHTPSDLTEIAYLNAVSANTPDTTEFFSLESGQFYYFELLNKGNGNGDYCSLTWRNSENEAFRTIDTDNLYTFESCDEICTPDGILCDDNDNGTYLDQYLDCECVGTPCDVPDCSNGINYLPFEACHPGDQHFNNQLDSWQSCETSPNPNPAHSDGHWVQFDLNDQYILHTSHIWNYNVENQTGKGFKDVTIDYSMDGENWTNFGTYEWSEASGLNNYEGFEGPDFGGLAMRYLLITAQSNWNGDDCAGFSEWKMYVEACPEMSNLDILGANEVTALEETTYQISNSTTNSSYDWMVTGGSIIQTNNDQITVLWNGDAPYEICVMETTVNGCNSSTTCQPISVVSSTEELTLQAQASVYPNPTSGQFSIGLPEQVELIDVSVYNGQGKLVLFQNYQEINLNAFPAGGYFIKINTSEGMVFKQLKLL